jgi:hypothetical protein
MMKHVFKSLAVAAMALAAVLSAGLFTATAQPQGSETLLPAVEAARRAGVPEAAISRLLAYGVDKQLRSEEMSRLLAVFIDIQKRDLPVAPFLGKVEEGLAKQIDTATLLGALNAKRKNYVFLNALLDVSTRKNDTRPVQALTLLADSLDFGLSRQELTHLLKENPGVSLIMVAVAAETKALLKQIQMDPALIDEIVGEGLTAKAFTWEWRKVSKIIAMAKFRGVPETRIAEATRNVLKNSGRLRDLLPGLGFMGRDMAHGPERAKD